MKEPNMSRLRSATAFAVALTCIFAVDFVFAAKGPKGGGGGAPKVAVSFRDEPGDASVTPAVLPDVIWSDGQGNYVEGEDGLNTWMQSETSNGQWPTSAVTTPTNGILPSTSRRIVVNGVSYILDFVRFDYPTVPAQGESADTEVRISYWISDRQLIQMNFELGSGAKIRVLETGDFVFEVHDATGLMTRKTYVYTKKGKKEQWTGVEYEDLGQVSAITFGMTFTQLP